MLGSLAGQTLTERARVWPVRLHAWHSCSVSSALWCGCSVVNLPSLFTIPHLGLYGRTHLSSPQSGYRPVGTMVQTIPGLHHITDMRQVHEYPESSISKVLTMLKWWNTTMLKRKLQEKQRVQI